MDLNTGRCRDVTSGDNARALLAQVRNNWFVVLRGNGKLLHVENDLGDVLLDTLNGRELVQNTLDAHAGYSGTRDGRKQSTAKRVTDRVAKTWLKRLKGEA